MYVILLLCTVYLTAVKDHEALTVEEGTHFSLIFTHPLLHATHMLS